MDLVKVRYRVDVHAKLLSINKIAHGRCMRAKTHLWPLFNNETKHRRGTIFILLLHNDHSRVF